MHMHMHMHTRCTCARLSHAAKHRALAEARARSEHNPALDPAARRAEQPPPPRGAALVRAG